MLRAVTCATLAAAFHEASFIANEKKMISDPTTLSIFILSHLGATYAYHKSVTKWTGVGLFALSCVGRYSNGVYSSSSFYRIR